MVNVRIGAAVRLYSVDTDDLGVVHAPPPVELRDCSRATTAGPLFERFAWSAST
jgi:hypothetical protein